MAEPSSLLLSARCAGCARWHPSLPLARLHTHARAHGRGLSGRQPRAQFRLDYALSREATNKRGGKMYIQDKACASPLPLPSLSPPPAYPLCNRRAASPASTR